MSRAGCRLAGAALAPLLILALSGCGVLRGVGSAVTSPFAGGGLRGAQTEIGELRFRTRVAATTADGRGFVATTSGAGRSPAGAAEAGRTQANAYCVRRFGGSEIVWAVGPDGPAGPIAVDGAGRVTLSGTCVTR